MRGTRCWLLALALVAACGRPGPEPATAVEVQLVGGPNPGDYRSSGPDLACVMKPLGPGSLGVQFTDWGGPKDGLRSLSLLVPAGGTAERFYLGLVFGDFFAGQVHEIETRAEAPMRRGAGKVTVIETPGRTTVLVTGHTADAVSLEATIVCQEQSTKEGVTP